MQVLAAQTFLLKIEQLILLEPQNHLCKRLFFPTKAHNPQTFLPECSGSDF
jgi:hypothetical protein